MHSEPTRESAPKQTFLGYFLDEASKTVLAGLISEICKKYNIENPDTPRSPHITIIPPISKQEFDYSSLTAELPKDISFSILKLEVFEVGEELKVALIITKVSLNEGLKTSIETARTAYMTEQGMRDEFGFNPHITLLKGIKKEIAEQIAKEFQFEKMDINAGLAISKKDTATKQEEIIRV